MRTTRRWSVIAFLAIATIMAAMFTAFTVSSATAAPATGYTKPTLTTATTCGGTGAVVTVSGDRFTPDATGVVTYNSTPETSATFTVSDKGTWSVPLTVPTASGGTTIRVNDSTAESASAAFSVATTCGTGGVTISNPNPTAGKSITVSGKSCTPGTTVTVSLDGGTVLGTTTAGSDGSYSIVVKIPAGISGSHTINVSGAGAGCSGVLPISITASNNGGGDGGLASTGVAVIGIGSLGVVLLVGGGLMLLAGRRRRTSTLV